MITVNVQINVVRVPEKNFAQNLKCMRFLDNYLNYINKNELKSLKIESEFKILPESKKIMDYSWLQNCVIEIW